MPRRKQGHLQTYKRQVNTTEKTHGRNGPKNKLLNETKLGTIPSSGRRGGRTSLRSKRAAFKDNNETNDNAAATSASKPCYLHKKFQRSDCKPSASNEQTVAPQETSSECAEKNMEQTLEPDVETSNRETGSSAEVMKSSKALEALLKVTEMEIIRSSTSNTTLTNSLVMDDNVSARTKPSNSSSINSICLSIGNNEILSSDEANKEKSDDSQTEALNPLSKVSLVLDSSLSPSPSCISSHVENEPKKIKNFRHICAFCNHAFAKPSVLKKHIRAHTNERPFPCKVCGFAFKTKSNLYKHCRSRAHSLKITENESFSNSDSNNDLSGICDNNGDLDEEGEKITDSETSCDALDTDSSAKFSVPNKDSNKNTFTDQSKNIANNDINVDYNPRVPPIKIHALMQHNQTFSNNSTSIVCSSSTNIGNQSSGNKNTDKSSSSYNLKLDDESSTNTSTRNSSASPFPSTSEDTHKVSMGFLDSSQNSNPDKVSSSRGCLEVSSMIYKPKFHSAIIGGSRKFIDHKNFSVDLTLNETNENLTESKDVSSDSFGYKKIIIENNTKDEDQKNEDGLMLRVMERKTSVSLTDQDKLSSSSCKSSINISEESKFLINSSKAVEPVLLDSNFSGNTDISVSKENSMIIPENQSKFKPSVVINQSLAAGEGVVANNNKCVVKSPRLASPEFLKQHISNLISRNTAIVETLNPLWSRRYLRQSSVASSQNIDAELRARDKIHHYSHENQANSSNVFPRPESEMGLNRQFTGSQSLPATPSVVLSAPSFTGVMLAEVKNQLYRNAVSSPTQGNNTVNKETVLSLTKNTNNVSNVNFPEPAIPESRIEKSVINASSNTAVENILVSNNVIAVSDEQSVGKELFIQHPENPEGSIIKNLLLKKQTPPLKSNRSSVLSTASVSSSKTSTNISISSSPEISSLEHTQVNFTSDSHSYLLHTCSVCQTSFRSSETLLAHQSHYCTKIQRTPYSLASSNLKANTISEFKKLEYKIEGNQSAKAKLPTDGNPKPRGRPKGSKNRPKDISLTSHPNISSQSSKSPLQQNSPIPIYNHITVASVPYASSESHGKTLNALKGKLVYRQVHEDGMMQENANYTNQKYTSHYLDKPESDNLNKKYIVENLDESLILKKHLLSGSLSGDKSPPLKKRKIPEEALLKTDNPSKVPPKNNSISTLRSLEELSRYPMRPSAVQLFGGEVQICDGTETKKMRIDTKIQQPLSSPGSLTVTNSSALPVHLVPVINNVQNNGETVLPSAVIVTIAKPVLNSGGTVLQMHDSKSQTTSPVCIPVVALGQPLMSTGMRTPNASPHPSISTTENSSSHSNKFNDVGAVVLNTNVSTPISVKSTGFYSIDISHLQINHPVPPWSPKSSNTPLTRPYTPTKISSCDHNTEMQNLKFSPQLASCFGNEFNPLSNKYSPDMKIGKTSTKSLTSPKIDLKDMSCKKMFSDNLSKRPNSLPLLACNLDASKFGSTVDKNTTEITNDLESNMKEADKTKNSKEEISVSKEKQPLLRTIPSISIQTVSSPNTSVNPTEGSSKAATGKEVSKSFLAPPRPTSLPLKSLHSSMVGTTLISPETPRPKKKYDQLYINGQYYTYLGLKCSTRVYYCCIYRPQPMYVPQSTDPKLSMYSNWQMVPADPDPLGLTPAETMSYYNSKPRSSGYVTAGPRKVDYLLTHSSYWTYKNCKNSMKGKSDVEKILSLKEDASERECESKDKPSLTPVTEVPENVETVETSKQSDFLTGPSGKQKCKEPSEHIRDSNKRVKIFEGGFKSNEEYTYVRGRGRGKYVCEECGIRCKKPSMLKKHIRTHTDVRPFTCKHCNFSFKTKGNLTKHMKSKAHHKKCIELGIDPVPVTIDEAQIDEEALARQERYEKERGQFVDDNESDEGYDMGEDEDDDDDDDDDEDDDDDDDEEDDDNDDEDDEEDDEDEEQENADDSMKEKLEEKGNPLKPSQLYAHDQFDDAVENATSTNRKQIQQVLIEYPEEHEAARSLLDLSNHGKMSLVTDMTHLENPGTALFDQVNAPKVSIEKESFQVEGSITPSHSQPNDSITQDPTVIPPNICESEELIGNPRVVWESNQTSEKIEEMSEISKEAALTLSVPPDFALAKTIKQVPSGILSLNKSSVQESLPSESIIEAKPYNSRDPSPSHHFLSSNRFSHNLPQDTMTDENIKYPLPVSMDCSYAKQKDTSPCSDHGQDFTTLEIDCQRLMTSEKMSVNNEDFDQPMDLSITSSRMIQPFHHSKFPSDYIDNKLISYPLSFSQSKVSEKCVEQQESPFLGPISHKTAVEQCHITSISESKAMEIYETISPPPNEIPQPEETQVPVEMLQPFSHVNGTRVITMSGKTSPTWKPQLTENSSKNSMLHAYLTDKHGECKVKKSTIMPTGRTNHEIALPSTASKSAHDYSPSSPIGMPNVTYAYNNPSMSTSSVKTSICSITATANENQPQAKFLLPPGSKFASYSHRSVDDGKCICDICDKSFTKPSQLRLHVNIHYFERPFRCDSCAVSFRTKGHLQKHRRSVSHYNKVNMNMTFGTPTTDNPRPFKCGDCKIAFRIHGHLAKHLRSKMHIMKLECLGKLPFGTYAEIERSGVNLNEIDTTDCENSLESLQLMAQRLYEKDPRRQRWTRERTISGCSADDGSDISHVTDDSLEGNRYRSLSLSDGGHISPDYSDVEVVVNATEKNRENSDIKQEPNEEHRSNEMYHRDQWEVLQQSSVESLSQEYEDISDAESELDPMTNCSICGQIFKDVKALHLHLYLEHSDGREPSLEVAVGIDNKNLPQMLSSDLRMRNVNISDDPALTIEMRMNNRHPHNVSVAMEMRRNTLSENAAIALEMRKSKTVESSALDKPRNDVSLYPSNHREEYSNLIVSTESLGDGADETKKDREKKKPNIMPSVSEDSKNATSKASPAKETVVFSFSQSSPSAMSLHLAERSKVHSLPCNLCGSVFNSQHSLKQHMLTHVQLRPFVCDVCDAGFTSKEYLWHHYTSHNQGKESSEDFLRAECTEAERSNTCAGNEGQIPIR